MASARSVCMAGWLQRRAAFPPIMFNAAAVLAGSLLIAACAQLAIPLPFTPVPVTGQTFAVLLVAAALGSRLGVAAVLAYLAEGAAGLPVFAGGAAGTHILWGPTAGYLAGFILAAAVVGRLADCGWTRRPWQAAAIMAAGEAIILAVGALVLATQAGVVSAWLQGVAPFIPGAIVKIAAAAAALPAAWRLLEIPGLEGRGPRM